MADSEDKTETATQRRIEKAREEGEVAVSRELSMLAGLAAGLMAIGMQFDPQALSRWLAVSLQHADFSGAAALQQAGITVLLTVAPIAFAAAMLYAAATVLQTEFLYRPGAITPDLSRISPLSGIKRVFSLQTVVSLLKSLAKLAVFVVCLWIAFGDLVPFLPAAPYRQSKNLSSQVLHLGARLAMMLLGAQAAIAAADVVWERMSLAKKLRMTRHEQREEHKESEGNPHVKAKLRQLARAMAKRRMMKAVPKAAVVLTNPTHYAVALHYERGSNGAPKVVAKGADEVAERIRDLAREHRVPIIANPPLARALFRVEIDTEIRRSISRRWRKSLPMSGACAAVRGAGERVRQMGPGTGTGRHRRCRVQGGTGRRGAARPAGRGAARQHSAADLAGGSFRRRYSGKTGGKACQGARHGAARGPPGSGDGRAGSGAWRARAVAGPGSAAAATWRRVAAGDRPHARAWPRGAARPVAAAAGGGRAGGRHRP